MYIFILGDRGNGNNMGAIFVSIFLITLCVASCIYYGFTKPQEKHTSWEQSGYRIVRTATPVVTNVVYAFPYDTRISVVFDRLPPDVGTLEMRHIILSERQKRMYKSVSEDAYDIRLFLNDGSEALDGSFSYTLTLPRVDTADGSVNIAYSQDISYGSDIITHISPRSMVVKEDHIVVYGLDHFTYFMVVSPEMDTDQCINASDPYSDTCYPTIQQAIDLAPDLFSYQDLTLTIYPGTYDEPIVISDKQRWTIRGSSAEDKPVLRQGILFEGTNQDITLQNLAIHQNTSHMPIVNVAGTVTNFTLDGLLLDGSGFEEVRGLIVSDTGSLEGDFAIHASIFRSVSHPLSTYVSTLSDMCGSSVDVVSLTHNMFDAVQGAIVIRGGGEGSTCDDPIQTVTLDGNYIDGVLPSSRTDNKYGFFQVGHAHDVYIRDNTIGDIGSMSVAETTPGVEYGAGIRLSNVSTMTIEQNTYTTNKQAIVIDNLDSVPVERRFIPQGMIAYNRFLANTQGIYIASSFADGQTFDDLSIEHNAFVHNAVAIHSDYGHSTLVVGTNWWGCNGGAGYRPVFNDGCASDTNGVSGMVVTAPPTQMSLVVSPTEIVSGDIVTATMMLSSMMPLGMPFSFATDTIPVDRVDMHTMSDAMSTSFPISNEGNVTITATLHDQTVSRTLIYSHDSSQSVASPAGSERIPSNVPLVTPIISEESIVVDTLSYDDAQQAIHNTNPCSGDVPSTPTIAHIDRDGDVAMLYLDAQEGEIDSIRIAYGIDQVTQQHEALFSYNSDNQQPYFINHLDTDTSYWYKVLAIRGCASSEWSVYRHDGHIRPMLPEAGASFMLCVFSLWLIVIGGISIRTSWYKKQ